MCYPLKYYPLGDVAISPNVIFIVRMYKEHKAKDLLEHLGQMLLLIETWNLSSYKI